jgi:hypothetical protein
MDEGRRDREIAKGGGFIRFWRQFGANALIPDIRQQSGLDRQARIAGYRIGVSA